ncbi:MAG: hypothetical protein BMS9Abin02_0860 [Anaerolineae bacterium]|nr:MAG: hypothetical protein BMS9Abin02_0860 [Anaerolineae bacterium]
MAEIIDNAVRLSAALEQAHAAGIVHRIFLMVAIL